MNDSQSATGEARSRKKSQIKHENTQQERDPIEEQEEKEEKNRISEEKE